MPGLLTPGDRLVTGIRTGTRLERLHALRRATKLQHELAHRYSRTHDADRLASLLARIDHTIRLETRARPEVAAAVRQADTTTATRLAALGVTTLDVKRWAHDQGLITTIVRGRVPTAVLTAYLEHHESEPTP